MNIDDFCSSPIKGILFDMDGTLVESPLVFGKIREDINKEGGRIDEKMLVLEYIEALEKNSPRIAEMARKIVDKHEALAVNDSALYPGVMDMFSYLAKEHIKKAIITRNSRIVAETVKSKYSLPIDLIVARDITPVKPDPFPLLYACKILNLRNEEVITIGDRGVDIEAGKRAGVRTVLALQREHSYQFKEQADVYVNSLSEIINICKKANHKL